VRSVVRWLLHLILETRGTKPILCAKEREMQLNTLLVLMSAPAAVSVSVAFRMGVDLGQFALAGSLLPVVMCKWV
jgi:hypothetical protein